MNGIKEYAEGLAKRAKDIVYEVAGKGTNDKNAALIAMAESINDHRSYIIDVNKKDLEFAEASGKNAAYLERLMLNDKRIDGMIQAIRDIAALPDPVGSGNMLSRRPNGLKIMKVRVPIGVVMMVYESRPNVTSDAAALTLKSGNTVILRGGKEAVNSNQAIANSIREALEHTGFPRDAVQLVDRTEHEIVNELLKLDKYIDVVIPRGGEGLIRAVVEASRIPVIKHDKGVCHVFIDQSADKAKAEAITVNAKVQRPSVCNAIESLLIHKDYPHAASVVKALVKNKVEVRIDRKSMKAVEGLPAGLKDATEDDWYTEYLDYIISVKMVRDVDDAIDHINTYGSHHSDSIVSEDYGNVQRFLDRVDSAAVYANASTRFTDGGVFGLGAEVGISTQKLHVRGPMGLEGLTTEKWVIYGDGQIRE
ncbi:MAG: glutamate-5-semialdehyde dehydrogenase [Spirochaetes bacterium GWF1_51_8]|nr:MAG: glutamate-5-semialdehyde dehydrogenase [Spirochaetes bacterium GWF1_51_8]